MNHKLKYAFLLAALVCGTSHAEDDNSFYFTDAAVMPGETTSIELCMRNTATDLTCLEAEIQLPEGLSVVCDEEGNPLATLYRNRTSGHEIMTNVLNNGNLKVLVSSISGNLIGGEEGPLLSFCVMAAETAPTGECMVETVGESLLVNSDAEAYYSVGVTGNVLITDDATRLTAIDGVQLADGNGVYDLGGRIMDSSSQNSGAGRAIINGKLPKGIYIVNGKKVVIK